MNAYFIAVVVLIDVVAVLATALLLHEVLKS